MPAGSVHPPAAPQVVVTVRGKGYMLADGGLA